MKKQAEAKELKQLAQLAQRRVLAQRRRIFSTKATGGKVGVISGGLDLQEVHYGRNLSMV